MHIYTLHKDKHVKQNHQLQTEKQDSKSTSIFS